MEKLYTTKETAELLNVSPRALQRYLREGKIHCVRLGRENRYTEKDIQDFIDALKKI